jgi:type II secretory pathway pseudopilin PulG
MGLRGQGSRVNGERGYAMAALLVALAVMAILMSVAMPVWRQQARREKEAELVFRGEQYARAIALYNFKNNQIGGRGFSLPPSIDVLVQGRYLRKKYKDPMTKDGEFALLTAGQTNPTQGGATPPGGRAGGPAPSANTGTVIGGISGVRSKSEENSLRSYRGQTRYDQWVFTFNNVQRPGGIVPPANTGDGRGGNPTVPPGTGPGGRRGTPPFGGAGGPTINGPRINPGSGQPGAPPPGGPRGTVPGGGRGPGL